MTFAWAAETTHPDNLPETPEMPQPAAQQLAEALGDRQDLRLTPGKNAGDLRPAGWASRDTCLARLRAVQQVRVARFRRAASHPERGTL